MLLSPFQDIMVELNMLLSPFQDIMVELCWLKD